ncbi:MAG: hypothetical protein V4615_05570 [Bacteroidota bacterium]
MLIFILLTSLDLCFAQGETINSTSAAGNFWKVKGNGSTVSNTNFVGTTDNVSLRFRTNNTEKAVIDSLGNMGIGITTPTERLQVGGNLRLDKAFMPGNSAGTASQFLLSAGANAAPTWSPFSIGNPTATTIIAKYYASLSWNGPWANGATRVFTITDPNCITASSISASFTGINALYDSINLNNVQTGNGSFNVSLTNNTGGSLMGAVSISIIAFY